MLEILHPHDTQLNEAMNNAFSYVAPKNKNDSRSMELMSRISMVIGMHNIGKYNFMKRFVTNMEMTDENQFMNSLRKEDLKKRKKQLQQKESTTTTNWETIENFRPFIWNIRKKGAEKSCENLGKFEY